ncbi:uncharacterized protein LOC133525237 isoform X2 [Cydia pomonella]|uniref:uncharacterized protein LOC133525237 isoform X2 n=1 Tax=Cydia pomonella TaxID=82600 RepID=UPI002ADE1790|nr:uncharacterized protein LOC133525237 isoform X2 [Cydia pomonella]
MSFKIVQTIENGRLLLWTVPSVWESNGILKWPLHKVEKLRRDPLSTPKDNWRSTGCIVKRNDIPTFQAANINKNMSDLSDTETETSKNVLSTYQTQQHLQSTSHESQDKDFNNLIRICDQQQPQMNQPTVEAEVTVHQAAESLPNYKHGQMNISASVDAEKSLPKFTTEQQPREQNYEIIVLPPEEAGALIPTNLTESIEALSSKLATIQDNQVVLSSNQILVLEKLAIISTQLDEFMQRISVAALTGKSERDVDNIFKPITNKKRFDDFEESLKSEHKKQEIKKQLSVICGKGKGRAINNAYALLDGMFDREFLTGCSWAGGTRAEAVA